MKKAKLGLMALIAITTHASAQYDGCDYGCNYKITYYSDASKTVKVGKDLSLCSDPENPILQEQRRTITHRSPVGVTD